MGHSMRPSRRSLTLRARKFRTTEIFGRGSLALRSSSICWTSSCDACVSLTEKRPQGPFAPRAQRSARLRRLTRREMSKTRMRKTLFRLESTLAEPVAATQRNPVLDRITPGRTPHSMAEAHRSETSTSSSFHFARPKSRIFRIRIWCGHRN